MGRYRWTMLLLVLCTFWSCKKSEKVDPVINVENVFVTFVRSNQIDITFNLSDLGYQEAGVSYYKKSAPDEPVLVKAIRENDQMRLSLQGLEPSTEYGFKVFYMQNDAKKTGSKEFTVKTLSSELAKFALEVKSPTINYLEDGSFSADIEGENLNNLNLSELIIKVNGTVVSMGYPTLIAGNRYKITVTGKVRPVNAYNSFSGLYQGKDIFFQSVQFIGNGDSYTLTYTPTNLKGSFTSIFNNELYYFYEKQVFKLDIGDERMVAQSNIPEGTINSNTVGIQFDGQLFFLPVEKGNYPNPNDLANYYNYPEVYSFIPGSNTLKIFPFKEHNYPKSDRSLTNNNYFIHKGELYLVYSLVDDYPSAPGLPLKQDDYIYHYNKSTKQFDLSLKMATEIINFHFVSVNNQMYLLGLVPVYDQGFKLTATFAVFKVSDNFTLEQIYKAGTVATPQTFITKHVVASDNKILIACDLDDYKIFDPSNLKLYQVYLKNYVSNSYLGGFFTYNNKLNLNTDQSFSSKTIYEISINKGN